ncbi:MAG: NAD(P)H-binding protein [Mycobacteriales bacterium]
MPVVVTGADSPLGELVIDRLAGRGLDLRATVDSRDAVQPLVDRGVKTAVSDLVDTERFGAVLEDAHTIIHLRGVDAARILAGVPDVIAALPDSGVERIVTLSGFGLEQHPALQELRDTGLDVVVFRVGVVLAPLSDPRAARPHVPPSAEIAPLYVDDLADALVAADHLRDLHGYTEIDAVGSDVVTGRQLDDVLGTRTGLLARVRRSRGDSVPMVGDRGARMAQLLDVRPMSLADAVAVAVR